MLVKINFTGGYLLCREEEIEQSVARLERAGHKVENITRSILLQMFVEGV